MNQEVKTINGYKVKDETARNNIGDLNLNRIKTFNNIANMKTDTTLIKGQHIKTRGYYEINDGGSAEYYITDTVSETDYQEELDNGLYATLIINKTSINAMKFGIKGDGTNDDSVAIQNAINTACNYINERTTSTDSFGSPIKIVLPNIKMYIKTPIESNEAIVIEGGGSNTTLILADDIDYIIKIKKDINTKSRNEETQIEGAGIKNVRFDGLSRTYTCTSAVHIEGTDHFILEDLYFMCIKGKCIELQASREGLINNIFTRFCGVYGVGNIEIIPNSNPSGDTSNLNIGNNWNIVFPFGNAIKFNKGEIKYVNNVVIHGMFDNIINSLESYFGVNEYEDEDNNFIELIDSNPSFNNLNGVYCPDKSVYINIDNSNNVSLMNSTLSGHKSTSESHGGDGNFIKLSNNSTIYLNNVNCTCAYQDADVFVIDSTSKVRGFISNQNQTYLNGNVENFTRASKFTIEGEKAQAVRFGYGNEFNYKIYNRDCRANIVMGQSNPSENLQTIQPDALYIGTNTYRTRAVVGIPDDAYFVLPQVNGTLSYINHTIFFDSDNKLKVNIYDETNQSYVTKTIKFED